MARLSNSDMVAISRREERTEAKLAKVKQENKDLARVISQQDEIIKELLEACKYTYSILNRLGADTLGGNAAQKCRNAIYKAEEVLHDTR
jgi:hypothetical protein